MYYFVRYESLPKKPTVNNGEPIESAIILLDLHPLIWATNPPILYSAHFTTKILFWAEIPRDTATRESVVARYGIELEINRMR